LNNKGKSPAESISQMMELVLPNHTNTMGKLFGGKLLEWIDMVATLAAKRHCNKSVVTAVMDKVEFLNPTNMGEVVELNSCVNRAFKTSMEVGVKVFSEDFKTGIRTHIASAYVTAVAVDDNGKPTKIPAILPETDDEIRRFTEAEHRREDRLKK